MSSPDSWTVPRPAAMSSSASRSPASPLRRAELRLIRGDGHVTADRDSAVGVHGEFHFIALADVKGLTDLLGQGRAAPWAGPSPWPVREAPVPSWPQACPWRTPRNQIFLTFLFFLYPLACSCSSFDRTGRHRRYAKLLCSRA